MSKNRRTITVPLAGLVVAAGLVGCGDDGDGSGADIDAAVATFDAAPVGDADPGNPDAGTFGSVTGTTATQATPSDGVLVTWTNPGGQSGVLVASSSSGEVGTPDDGTSYAVGDALPGGGKVLFVGDDSSFLDNAFNPDDRNRYAVFAFDGANNYAAPGTAEITPTVGTSITIDTGALTGTINGDPGPYDLNLGTITLDAGTLTVPLDITNGLGRIAFNLKAVVTSVDDGTASTMSGTYDGNSFHYYGTNGLDVGATTEPGNIIIEGVTGASVTIELTILEHPMVFCGAGYNNGIELVDSSGWLGQPGDRVRADDIRYRNADDTLQAGVASPDGRFLYLATRQQPTVVQVDTLTMTPGLTIDLTVGDSNAATNTPNLQNDGTGSVGATRNVTMSPDASTLYATLVTGTHGIRSNDNAGGAETDGDIAFVAVDRATMAEVGRITLVTGGVRNDTPGTAGLSPNGMYAAVPIRDNGEGNGGRVWLINTQTMSIVDADAAADGDQPFDVSSVGLVPNRAIPSSDGSTIFVGYSASSSTLADASVTTIDTATGTLGSLTPTTAGINHQAGALEFGPDGRLYYGRKDGAAVSLSIFNPDDSTWVEPTDTVGRANALAFSGDGSVYICGSGTTPALGRLDSATDAPLAFPATGDATVPFQIGNQVSEVGIVTPF